MGLSELTELTYKLLTQLQLLTILSGFKSGTQPLAIVEIGGLIVDETFLFIFFGVIIVAAGVIFFQFKSRGQGQNEPVTEAWEFEASGLLWPVPVIKEEPTSIEYKVQYSKSMEPVSRIVKHSHPFTPVASSQRVFLVPRGSTTAIDPRASFEEGQDQDDPEPLIQESASWYRRAREMMEAGGLKLKENWFTLLMLGTALFFIGVVIEAKFQLVPSG